jgi:hypothetical protein
LVVFAGCCFVVWLVFGGVVLDVVWWLLACVVDCLSCLIFLLCVFPSCLAGGVPARCAVGLVGLFVCWLVVGLVSGARLFPSPSEALGLVGWLLGWLLVGLAVWLVGWLVVG